MADPSSAKENDMMFRRLAISTVIATAALLAGCSSAQKGAAAGGAIGGIAGGVVGHNVGTIGTAHGIVMGSGGGAAVGGLAGDAYDQVNKTDQERELQNMRAELAAKEAELAALRENTVSNDQIAALNAEKADLERRIADLNAKNNELSARANSLTTAQADLAALNAELEGQNKRIGDLNDRLSAANRSLEDALRAKEAAERDRRALEGDMRGLKGEMELKEQQLQDARNKAQILQTSVDNKAAEMEKLRRELADMNVKLEETARGITLTIAEQFLYRPGRAELSPEGNALIAQVAGIISVNFPGQEIVVEGHTDNQPIKKSGWKSNWELGSARALSVVHELINKQGFSPSLVSATTYGEFRPESDNSSAEARKLNRRSVIVILPAKMPVQKTALAQGA